MVFSFEGTGKRVSVNVKQYFEDLEKLVEVSKECATLKCQF